ncbi:MAG: FtsX-like permease family protein [Bacteroidales bacterium]|nr:FtsX-like permease family protein [Bacteroidales bacterium]
MLSYFRFLYRNKLYTLINVLGLAVSMMFVILIGDYTWRQFSVDSWHKNKDRIFLLGTESYFYSWPDVTREIGAMYPEIEKTCCVLSHSGEIKYGWKYFDPDYSADIMLADSTFFDFFDFKIVKGDRKTALGSPDKCVITESLAEYFFKDADPIGKPLNIKGNRYMRINDGTNIDPYDTTLVYTVSAVVEDFDRTIFPNETKIITRIERQPQICGFNFSRRTSSAGQNGGVSSFLMMKEGEDLTPKLESVYEYEAKNVSAFNFLKSKSVTLTPLDEIMFAPQNHGEGMLKGEKNRIRILLSAIIAILLFAIMNYINLTTANTGFRAREMATKRLLGSRASSVFIALIAESTLMVLVAFLIGFFLAYNLQEDFMSLFQGKICLANDLNVNTIGLSVVFILFTGIISGVIPSVQIMKFKPIDVVKGSFRYNSKMVMSRLFIIIQNVITITMLTASLVIILQINHLVNAPLGVSAKNVFSVVSDNKDVARDALERLPCVEKVGVGLGIANGVFSVFYYQDENGNYKTLFNAEMDSVGFEINGLTVLEDYGFSPGAAYLNEEAMRLLNIDKSARSLKIFGEDIPLAGIVADFRMGSILADPQPVMIRIKKQEDMPHASLIVKSDGSRDAGRKIYEAMSVVKGVGNVSGEKYEDLQSSISENFENERNTLKIVSLFTAIAVVISVLGLLGISVFFLRQRKKEIGIRRIMGSTVKEVTVLTLSKFCAPLLLSFVLAVPLSYLVMNEWLKNFSYRISLSPWIFLVAMLFSLLIAVFSVFFQTWKAANSNPVESLKKE